MFLKPNQIIKWSGNKKNYNLCIVLKPFLEINGSHIYGISKGGGLGGGLAPQKPRNFKESILPEGLWYMVSYVKKT